MPAIDFPNSPSSGQDYTVGTTTWTYDGSKWNLKTANAVSNDSMPVGAIMWFGGSSAPTAWLACNGAAVSRTTYATLFSTIGTTYGVGDNSTTFNLPSILSTTGSYYIRYTTSLGAVTTTALATAPVGTMFDWPTTSSYPTGFLRADGTAVSRTTYADLYALCGSTYGSGDDLSTFNLPNIAAAGAGSPVKIIKATGSGVIEPSTVAHASSHGAGGSDVISIRQSQINDFVFTTEAARDAAITSPTEGMRAYLTAPAVPLATASDYVGTPTGVQTIYNGAVWVCVTPVGALTFASGTTPSFTFTATLSGSPGTNPAVTLVTGTSALVYLKALMANSSATQTNVSFAISGATTRGAFVDFGIQTNQIAAINAGGTIMVTGLTAGTNTFTMQYSAPAGTGTFARRSIVVQGVA